MSTNARAMVLASFAADALSLGAHWIYDTKLIDQKFGRPDRFFTPEPPTYHGNRKAGDFTHYGDQTLIVLESLAAASGYDLEIFAKTWRTLFDDYDGYFDGATKKTLANLGSGTGLEMAGSNSDDLAGAARIAPLVYYYRGDPEKLIDAARSQTALTHNHPHVIDAAAIFSQIALEALAGNSPRDAISNLQSNPATDETLSGWLSDGLESIGTETREAIGQFGQMCEIGSALPATIHLIAKYEDALSDALIENVRAGGDSAGRGLVVGMVLGAYQGLSSLPSPWMTEMNAHDRIITLLDSLDGA